MEGEYVILKITGLLYYTELYVLVVIPWVYR